MSHSFKQITPTDKFGWHQQLLPVYEKLFAPFKDRTMQLLEIGTDGGGGLRMYQDYFSSGRIVGIDISPTPDAVKDVARIVHVQGDAYTEAQVLSIAAKFGRFDICLDDGPHTLGSQEFFVANYPRLLTPDGIAIVEDIQDPAHIAVLEKCVPDGFSSMEIDLRHIEPARYDNLIMVIWH